MPLARGGLRTEAGSGSAPVRGAHGFVWLAVSRNTSKAVITIQPTGYGKTPVKKASRVAISKTINSAAIQSILI